MPAIDLTTGDRTDYSARNAVAVTKNNDSELTNVSKGIYVGTTGDLTVVMADGGATTVLFPSVPAGAFLPIRVRKVMSTGTTASGIVAVW